MRKIEVNGESFFVRDGDAGELDRNVVAEVYGLDTYRCQQRCHINPKFVLDIGAHIGAFTKKAKMVWPEAKFICVEPNPISFQLLVENTKKLADIVCLEGAARYDDANVLTDGVGATGGGYMIPAWGIKNLEGSPYTVAAENVKLYTIEEISTEVSEIDLIKMDCEGSEANIFQCISNECIAKIKYMMGEYHGFLEGFLELVHRRLKEFRWEIIGWDTIGTFFAWRV